MWKVIFVLVFSSFLSDPLSVFKDRALLLLLLNDGDVLGDENEKILLGDISCGDEKSNDGLGRSCGSFVIFSVFNDEFNFAELLSSL